MISGLLQYLCAHEASLLSLSITPDAPLSLTRHEVVKDKGQEDDGHHGRSLRPISDQQLRPIRHEGASDDESGKESCERQGERKRKRGRERERDGDGGGRARGRERAIETQGGEGCRELVREKRERRGGRGQERNEKIGVIYMC